MINPCKKISYTVLAVFAVDLLATSGDMTMTWTSPIIPKLENNDTSDNPLGRTITKDEDAWLASLINVGAIVGPFPYGFLSEKLGRKIALLSVAIPHIIAYLTFAFATDIGFYYFGRIIGGLAVGGGYTLMPMYIAEIAEDSNRGALSVTLNVFWGLGNLIPYAIGPYLSVRWFNIIIACIPSAFFIIFLLVAPESPYYLVSKNKLDKAEEALMLLRSSGKEVAKKEVEQIQLTLARHENGTIWDIFKERPLRKALYISIVLMALNQFCGINAVAFYLQPILESVHSFISADLGSTVCGVFTFLSSFIMFFLADRIGRKPLLIVSSFATAIPLAVLGVFLYLQHDTDVDIENISFLPFLCMIVFVVAFNTGVSALPWIVSAELFPTKVKGISATTVTCICWVFSFLITKFFNNMNDAMGMAGTFWFFGGCSVAGGIFCVFFLPETKGKSFNEIQDML